MQTELTPEIFLAPPREVAVDRTEELKEVLMHSDEVRGTKNLNEHLNCTKQECGSSWK